MNTQHLILRVAHVQVKTKTQPQTTSKTFKKAYDGSYSLQTPIQHFLNHSNRATAYPVEVDSKGLFGF